MKQSLHENSLEAFAQITRTSEKERRRGLILEAYKRVGNRPLTDAEVLALCFPGRENINLVQPRITELRDDGILIEIPRGGRSADGSRSVRTTYLKTFDPQISLF